VQKNAKKMPFLSIFNRKVVFVHEFLHKLLLKIQKNLSSTCISIKKQTKNNSFILKIDENVQPSPAPELKQ
jgi:hypothetical protein